MTSGLTSKELNEMMSEINNPNPKTVKELKEELGKHMSGIKKLG